MREVFEDIEQKLNNTFDINGNKVFGTVALNRGQMLQVKGMQNTGANITFPAIFYKPEEIKSIPRPNNIYVVQMRIRFQLVIDNLIHEDYLSIFDLSTIMDQTLLDAKWNTTNLASIQKGFNVFPDSFDNNLIYEGNFWVKYWSTESYTYRNFVDANINKDIDIKVCGDLFIINDENTEIGTIPVLSNSNGALLINNLHKKLGKNASN